MSDLLGLISKMFILFSTTSANMRLSPFLIVFTQLFETVMKRYSLILKILIWLAFSYKVFAFSYKVFASVIKFLRSVIKFLRRS